MKKTKNMNGKGIKTVAFWIITIVLTTLFSVVWLKVYNNMAFRSHRFLGGILTILLFATIYVKMAKMYNGFRFATLPLLETCFSQFLAVIFADAFLFVECCMIAHGWVTIWPMLLVLLLQCITITVWALAFKWWYIKQVDPQRTALVFGDEDPLYFKVKLESRYGHLFQIGDIVSADTNLQNIYKVIDQNKAVILYDVRANKRTALIEYCMQKGVDFYLTPRIADLMIEGFTPRHFLDTPLLQYAYHYDNKGKQLMKRLMDIVISLVGIILLSPIMLITALAIKIEDGGSIFFRQDRCTKNGKVFSILKFRSMVEDPNKEDRVIPCMQNDTRITKVGNVIRRFRIDELPQLLNVLMGDMSVVGPRPERVEHVEKYTADVPEFAYRMRAKGGLTGYAQIYGKYNTSAEDKLKLDLMYIENQSILLDLKLMFLTVKILFIPESTEGFDEEKSRIMTANVEQMQSFKDNKESKSSARSAN